MSKQSRLSINLSPDAADFLDKIKDKYKISYTEAIRRSLAIYKLIEDQTELDHQIQIDDGNKIYKLFIV